MDVEVNFVQIHLTRLTIDLISVTYNFGDIGVMYPWKAVVWGKNRV